jgi:hypothetical protein
MLFGEVRARPISIAIHPLSMPTSSEGHRRPSIRRINSSSPYHLYLFRQETHFPGTAYRASLDLPSNPCALPVFSYHLAPERSLCPSSSSSSTSSSLSSGSLSSGSSSAIRLSLSSSVPGASAPLYSRGRDASPRIGLAAGHCAEGVGLTTSTCCTASESDIVMSQLVADLGGDSHSSVSIGRCLLPLA